MKSFVSIIIVQDIYVCERSFLIMMHSYMAIQTCRWIYVKSVLVGW